MSELLADVLHVLAERGVPIALIGAGALAAHGIARSTLDSDLLTTDARVLDRDFWHGLAAAQADVRRGEADDPLLGVVRLRPPAGRDVDVIVGRHAWERDIVARAQGIRIETAVVPVATLPDLVLLKLYAGGSQDAWDIGQALSRDVSGDLVRAVEERLPDLPDEARTLWTRIRGAS